MLLKLTDVCVQFAYSTANNVFPLPLKGARQTGSSGKLLYVTNRTSGCFRIRRPRHFAENRDVQISVPDIDMCTLFMCFICATRLDRKMSFRFSKSLWSTNIIFLCEENQSRFVSTFLYAIMWTDRDTIDGTATCYGLDAQWIESRWRRNFPDSYTPTMGPTHSPAQWQPGYYRK
jgi:hypothetical protein